MPPGGRWPTDAPTPREQRSRRVLASEVSDLGHDVWRSAQVFGDRLVDGEEIDAELVAELRRQSIAALFLASTAEQIAPGVEEFTEAEWAEFSAEEMQRLYSSVMEQQI